jgi:hypothetical protein
MRVAEPWRFVETVRPMTNGAGFWIRYVATDPQFLTSLRGRKYIASVV